MANKNSTHTSDQLREKLLGIHISLQRKEKQNALFSGAILSLIWISVLIFVEEILYLAPSVKITLLSLLIGVTGMAIWIGLRSLKSSSFIEFYRSFARSSNLQELSYALDLEKSSNANPKLVEAAIFKNLEQVNPQVLDENLTSFLEGSRVTHQLKLKRNIGLASLVILLITGFSLQSSSIRLAQFWETFEKPNPFFYTVNPGNITQEQGTPFTTSIAFEGALPRRVSLMVKTPVEDNFRSRNMEASGSTYSSLPFDLNSDLEYYIEMDGYRSPTYKASVQLRPRFSELTVVITPPEYTQLDSTVLRYPFSLVHGYQGSQISISGVTNKKLNEFSLLRNQERTDLQTNNFQAFNFSFELSDPDTLSFELADENGLSNQNPFQFTVDPLRDEFPYIELLQPASSFEAVDPSLIDILFRPSDDFELTSASLNYELRKAFVGEPITGNLTLDRPENGVLQSFSWDVSDLQLKPKDELLFWIEVSDNDGYLGFKTSRSELISLTVPSLIDYFDDLGDKENEVETDLEDISEAFDEMSEQYDTFKEQLKENPETNFEQQRQLQEVQRQQEEIEKRIQELNEKFEEIKEELSENNMLSEETMEAYQELQELMKEIDDPAFREALQKLQDQMSEMSPEQLRDALQDAEFNEELYKQRLERTLELFKQLKLNSDLEKLAEAYEDLARQEEELENQSGDSHEQAEQRKSTLEQTQQLKEQIEELSENTTGKTEESVSAYQEMSQKELERIQQELEKMLEELQKESVGENSESAERENDKPNDSEQKPGDQPQQQQNQQNLKEDFQKLAEMTRNTMQQMQQQQMNVNIAGLQYILYSLLNLSVEQEDLVEYASSTENRSQAYIEYAREQKNVEDIFISLSDSLFALSKDIPQFSNQINEKKEEVEQRLTNSLEQMAERNQNRASVATRQAMGGINEIAFMIANLLEQLQNSSNGSGGNGGMSMQQMMEQMQQMGENQQQLNQQMQDLINDMQGERLTQDQMERLNQLSKQQNAIRKQLQELQRNGELEGGDQLGSEIERMIEEMEDTINDLRGGAIDPTLIELQQNILSRMLEAEQALQERDEEEKREGTTGQDVIQPTPPELTLEELEKQIQNRLNDPNFTKYSADYQRLIERYFELLKRIQEREI